MKQSWLPALRGVRCDNAGTEKTENGAPARGGTDKKVRSRFYGCGKGRRKEKNKKVPYGLMYVKLCVLMINLVKLNLKLKKSNSFVVHI